MRNCILPFLNIKIKIQFYLFKINKTKNKSRIHAMALLVFYFCLVKKYSIFVNKLKGPYFMHILVANW